MKNKDFCIFILTHGRPDRVYTYNTFVNRGYTGKIYIIVDNEDKTIDKYKEIYGDKVIIFDKLAVSKTFDNGDNFDDRRAIIYARNATFQIAKDLGITYFMQLDDDYVDIQYRIDNEYQYPTGYFMVKEKVDVLIDALLEYYKSIDAKSIAIAQGGDFIGGSESDILDNIYRRRKCMNTFICSTERPFKFVGRINEDVNTYTWYQSQGNLFLTFPLLTIKQHQTQTNSGGMTDLYLNSGTYVKSFFSILYSPSCVKIAVMGPANKRLHHNIAWKNAVPLIIDEKYKKY